MKKIKNPAIFFVLSIYFIGIILTFSGDLINRVQDVRYKHQIDKIEKAIILKFTIDEWTNFAGANEIKFKNSYYDVVSFKQINNEIFAKVIRDDFENETRIVLSKIFNKCKMPHSKEKKSNSFSKHILLDYKTICKNNINFYIANSQIFDIISCSKITDYINFLEKPPCVFNFY